MSTIESLEQAKMMSLLDYKPCIDGKFCFWFGLVMPTKYAFIIASSKVCKIPVGVSMKKELYEDYYYMFDDFRQIGFDPGFKLEDYSYDRVWKYLSVEVHNKSDNLSMLKHWLDTPKEMFKHFFVNQ
jgi:hypothetical protein